MDIALVLALWLHTVAFVIAWGYYGILGRMVLPALQKKLSVLDRASALVEIERRALPLVLISVVIFIVSGSYLLVVSPQYAGLGNIGASGWTMLMTLKHIVVIGLVGVGVLCDWLIRGLANEGNEDLIKTDWTRIRWTAEVATGLGALTALLTVLAQLA